MLLLPDESSNLSEKEDHLHHREGQIGTYPSHCLKEIPQPGYPDVKPKEEGPRAVRQLLVLEAGRVD